jgi:hypothetical protein
MATERGFSKISFSTKKVNEGFAKGWVFGELRRGGLWRGLASKDLRLLEVTGVITIDEYKEELEVEVQVVGEFLQQVQTNFSSLKSNISTLEIYLDYLNYSILRNFKKDVFTYYIPSAQFFIGNP